MKKIFVILLCVLVVSACSKHDPILPGVRTDVFDNNDVDVLGMEISTLSGGLKNIYGDSPCDYRQDENNIIWSGDSKIYIGFPVDTYVRGKQSPVCVGRFVYAGLSTGEVVKINPKTKHIVWTTDVYRGNNLTGGSNVVDIVARVGVDGNYVYAGGLGDAFCKLNANNGNRIWCLDISVPVDFIIVDNFAFVVGNENKLYAINTDNGKIYWATDIKKQSQPQYKDNMIIVDKQKMNYTNGELVK